MDGFENQLMLPNKWSNSVSILYRAKLLAFSFENAPLGFVILNSKQKKNSSIQQICEITNWTL